MKVYNMKKQNKDDKLSQAMDLIIESGVDVRTLFDKDGLFKQLTKGLVERALNAEMSEHLGYEKHDISDNDNYRNGNSTKTLISESGNIGIEVPRDRNSSFEPILIPKRTTRLKGLEDKIISLYAKGMSVSDIQEQLIELYGGADISTALISRITDEVMDEVYVWQKRALDRVYPIVFFDCLFIKVRHEKQIINKAVYVALGINSDGLKDVIGLWISENEGAKFWLNNLTELKNRGVQDILISCSDNLSGMTQALEAAFPQTNHQLCIVHQIRNSLKYVSYKDKKEVANDLKTIYGDKVIDEDTALKSLDAFANKWDSKYPQIAKSWYKNWDNLVIFLGFPKEIRKIIYTTNSIESLNSQLRKVTKNKRSFPSDDAVFKNLYLAIEYIVRKWTMPIQNW